jgi:hypothetical protein
LIKELRERLKALGAPQDVKDFAGGFEVIRKAPPKVREDLIQELLDREHKLLQMLIEAVQFNKNVELELIVTCLDVVKNEFGISEDEESQQVAEALFDVGVRLHQLFERQLRAYQRGYLMYHYLRSLGADIVLCRVVPPDLNH